MSSPFFVRCFLVVLVCYAFGCASAIARQKDAPAKSPKMGETARDFSLSDVSGNPVRLWQLTAQGPVVLVVLRGYPGYTCPLCTAQLADLRAHAKEFAAAGARVLLVYPGSGDGLKQHAADFLKDGALPGGFLLALDPDYKFTGAYGLRWNAAGETAYPSTFVIDGQNTVRLAKVSRTHGDRLSAAEALAVLPKRKP